MQKHSIYIAILNVRTLNRIGQLPELTASASEHNIEIVCVQEHQRELEIKYHDTGNGWISISASAKKKKKSGNAVIWAVEMLFNLRAQK